MSSIKSLARDRPRHSSNFSQMSVKRGGAGSYSWGTPADDVKYADEIFDSLDPNYDDFEDVDWTSFEPESEPLPEMADNFNKTLETVSQFKTTVREACRTFFVSYEFDDFQASLVQLNAYEFHHEVAKLLISLSLDTTEETRHETAHLLRHLFENDVLTRPQIEFSFRRLFNRLPDLLLDVPQADEMLKDFLRRATVAGLVDPTITEILLDGCASLKNSEETLASKKRINSMIVEYLNNEDMADIVMSIDEMSAPHFHHELVKKAIYISMDRHNRERELVSRLLAVAPLAPSEIQKAFEQLLDRVDDLVADYPQILQHLSCFLARAVVDECIEPAFLIRIDLKQSDLGLQVIGHAQYLLAKKHSAARIARIWGASSSCNSIAELKQAIHVLIDEYFEAQDLDEAIQCIDDLNVPHYHHEVVKMLFKYGVDKGEGHLEKISVLLSKAAQKNVMGLRQISKGFDRIYFSLEDLQVDVPQAQALFDQLVKNGKEIGYLMSDYVPSKDKSRLSLGE